MLKEQVLYKTGYFCTTVYSCVPRTVIDCVFRLNTRGYQQVIEFWKIHYLQDHIL